MGSTALSFRLTTNGPPRPRSMRFSRGRRRTWPDAARCNREIIRERGSLTRNMARFQDRLDAVVAQRTRARLLKVLLTGATGNLGTTLTRSRAAEFVPVGPSRTGASLPELLASGIDAVLHTAWDLKTPVTQRPEAVLDANLMTTTRLLEACREHGVEKFAMISTCAVYGESMNTAEDADCCPVTINGITKLLNERIVQAFCADAGIDCQIYRVFNMFGGDDRFSILSHLRNALDRDSAVQLEQRRGRPARFHPRR